MIYLTLREKYSVCSPTMREVAGTSMESSSRDVIILGGKRDSTWIVANALKEHFNIKCIIVEDRPSAFMMMKRRAAKLGWLKTAGQMFFIAFSTMVQFESRRRALEIKKQYALDDNSPAGIPIMNVKSANHETTIDMIKGIDPAVVVVNGTRILSGSLLRRIEAIFINMHAGITPTYRGVHGVG